MRAIVLAIPALLLLASLPPTASAESRPGWIPPDGPAGPTVTLGAILSGAVAAGTEVTTQRATVTRLSCPSCDEATVAADFWIKDASGATVWVHVPNTWQATWNVKKQNFVPAVGQSVIVQGVTGYSSGQHMLTMKRFSIPGDPGPTARAYDIAAGKYPTGTYVWVAPVKVLNRGHWPDGDYTYAMRDAAGGGMVYVENSPPYWGQLRVLNVGDVVSPYGQVRFDPDHNWWELHPVRCWSHTECVPDVASYVRNGPPPGTPAPPGKMEQGTEVPLWVPLSSTGSTSTTGTTGTAGTSFAVKGNDWWLQTTVSSPQTVLSVDAAVNNGAWVPITNYGWGWAKSVHAPVGSHVVFRAHLSGGAIATSVSYAWPPP